MDIELIVQNICTQGFQIIEDFLELEQYLALRRTAENLYAQGLFKSAKIGRAIQAHENKEIRTDDILWLDEQDENPAVKIYLARMHLLAQGLNQALFLGLNECETHFAAYQPGAYYTMHVDQFSANKRRKISFVYYLNQNWQEEFGGELKLYNQDQHLLKSVTPQGNRFICFNSELPHEVCLTHQPRYSIAGWMKTR